MRRAWSDARLDRLIERELTEGLSARQRTRLHDRLRQDSRARARYDRAVNALRVFEGDAEFASIEFDVVERWLSDTGPVAAPGADAWRWWPALTAALAAALVLLWLGPRVPLGERPFALDEDRDRDDSWQAKGPGASGGLALEVLCGPPSSSDATPVALRARDCQLGDRMGFAYRVPEHATGQLTLFGVDVDGDVMYYLPTPVDPAGATVTPGRWQPLPVAIELSVNHVPGALRIYGLVAPSVATSDEVSAWAAALAPEAPATVGDPPWIERIDAPMLSRVCPPSTECHAAELSLTLRP